MTLDPKDAWRLDTVEGDVNSLIDTVSKVHQRTLALNARLRVVESRNKLLWGLVVALLLALIGSAGSSLYRGGTVDANQAAQAKTIDSLEMRLRAVEAKPPGRVRGKAPA